MGLNDIRMINRDPVTGKITWGMTSQPKPIYGIDKLAQTFAIAILNDAGRDALEPTKGGGILSLIGQYNFSEDSLSPVMDEMYRRLDKAATEIKQDQATLINEDPLSMLNTYRVVDFGSDTEGQIFLKIRLVSMAGTAVDITV